MLRSLFPPILVLLTALLLLQFGNTFARERNWLKPYLLPTPLEVARVFIPSSPDPELLEQARLVRAQLLRALWGTTQGALLGFCLSLAVGTILAISMASSTFLRRAFYPYAVLFQTVPIIAIAPLLVIWFDYGLPVVIAASFIASLFPVIANTLTGLLSTDPNLRDMFRLYRASPLATIFKLRIPSALPAMFTGYRIAAGLAVVGAIVGEFVSSSAFDSLGGVIDTARTLQRTDIVFAAVLLASLLGITLFLLINLTATLTLRHWHASEQH